MGEFLLGGMVLLISFFSSLFLTKTWIKVAKKSGLVGKDMNKKDEKDVPEGGGIAIVLSFSLGLLMLVFLKTFYFNTSTHMIEILTVIVSILLAGILGFVDDILGWKKGLKRWQKPILTVPIAIPLMVLNAGQSIMSIPFIGPVDFGIIYPLLIIPIGIVGASNGFNMIAGLNGLESGMGCLILGTLSTIAFFNQNYWISFTSLLMVFSILGFLIFNRYPSRIFPGDSMTYSTGALIAIIAILGDMEKIAIILFIPYFIELVLKMRLKFKAESFGYMENGKLKSKYKKIYSINHIFMKKFNEKGIVVGILLIETLFIIISLVI